jgi:hypothetical protein
MRRTLALVLGVIGTGALAGSLPVPGARTPANQAVLEPIWAEAKWPFAPDQWGVGRTFVCAPGDCGTRIEIYVRPKIGFCNCATGVSDDAELERVGDTDMVDAKARAVDGGRPIRIGWMKGLSRRYQAREGPVRGSLLSIAANDECDVVVALAVLGDGDPGVAEPAVMAFLNSNPIVLWAKKELGLEFMRRDWR